MLAEVITIGDEILIGQIVDTNSAWLGSRLSEIGIQVVQITSVSDKKEAIVEAVAQARKRAQLVLVTGGLGPTNDDITKHTLTELFGGQLVTNIEVLKQLKTWFEQRGREISNINARQADLPNNCEVLENALGTAQGMLWRIEGNLVLSMPGVPYEMKWIVDKQLIPLLKKEFALPVLLHRTIMTCGMVESRIAEKIAAIEASLPSHIKLAYLPRPGIVRLRLSARGTSKSALEQDVAVYEHHIVDMLGHHVFGYDDEQLESAIGRKLKALGATLATAESCTGGTIGSMLTRIAGASAYFQGGVISYTNEAKVDLLGVKAATLAEHGAVSEAVVLEMAHGVKNRLNSTYGISVSGIAGPDGGTPNKPVGTVCIAVSGPVNNAARTYNFGTERSLNIERASMTALYMLWKMLQLN